MKKYLLGMVIALSALIGCTDEDMGGRRFANGSIQATFEQGTPNSRMAIGEGNALTWTSGDAFAMFADDRTNKPWTLDDGSEGQANGSFSGEVPGETLKGAIYPASANPEIDANGVLTMSLPSELTYSEDALCNLPMWASFTSLDAQISFRHLGALLKIDFANIPAGYNQLKVEASKPLSGTFAADLTQDEPVLVATNTGQESGIVTVRFNAFTETAETNKHLFYIPLPVAEYDFIQVSVTGEEKNDILLAKWENRDIVRTKVYYASVTYKEVEAGTPVAVNSALESLAEIPVVQVAVTGAVDATASDAGAIEIPLRTDDKKTNVSLGFENVPTTDENNPLTIKETGNTSSEGNTGGEGSEEGEGSEGSEGGETPSTTPETTKTNELTINIPNAESGEETHLDLQTPNTTVNVTGGTYATITAATASNTLVIGKGVSVARLIIEAGNVVLEGKITGSIERGANNMDEITTIILEEGAEIAENILNSLVSIVVKHRDEILLESAQQGLTQTLSLMVSQVMKNQGQGAEQGLMIAREALADDMLWQRNTWYKSHLIWECNSDATSSYNNRFWAFYYGRINEANLILELLDRIKGDKLSQVQQEEYNQIKGEALALRASHHFHLVQLYADRYVAGASNSQEGIQYRKSTNVATWTTSTVEEVYASINKDLDEACTLLESTEQKTPAHYNEKVAWGLKARVAMAMGNYTDAATYAEKAIELAEADGNALMTGEQLYHGFADITTQTSEAMLADVPDGTTYFYSFYAYMSWNFSSTSIRWGVKCINADTYDTMSETDLRRAWWDPTGEAEVPAASYSQVPYQNRKFTARSDSDSKLSDGDLAFMRLAEMYLTHAEALARSGNDTEAQAVFTEFQQTRDPEYVNSGNTGDALIEEIMNSRRVELWGEGFRFYDLKRLHLPIKRGRNFANIDMYGTQIFLEKDADDEGWTFAKPN